MNILVTGAAGYIGRHVVASLLNYEVEIYASDLSEHGLPKSSRVHFVGGNIFQDKSIVNNLPAINTVIHLAWQDGFKHNAASHMLNLGGHFDFIQRLVDAGVGHVVVMGTMHEVGYYEGAISDATPCKPLSLYGIAKNALREALMLHLNQTKVCFQWLRGFYIYGDDTFNHSIFTKILQAAAAGQEHFPFTSGKNLYDFITVQSLADMIVAASLQEKVRGIINICSGHPQSLAEVVEQFIKEHQLNIQLDYGAFPDRPYDSPGVWGDATKINQIMEAR